MINKNHQTFYQMGLLDFDDDIKPFKIDKPIRLIELFAGIGAQAKALENIGVEFEHYKICEFDPFAIRSYNAVHGTNFETSDITKIHAEDLEIEDADKYEYIMTYSFPCTDLSLAGKQKGMKKGSGTRSGLLWEVERLLKELNQKGKNHLPKVLLLENVAQLLSYKNRLDFDDWCHFLSSLGYENYYKILNAKDFGIPQDRERCFMVSILGDGYYTFPKPKKLTICLKDIFEQEVDEKYVLSDKMIDGMKKTSFSQYKLENKLKDINGIADTILARFEGCPQCRLDSLGRLVRYTPKECWRLMGFSDEDFDKAKKAGLSDSKLYKQAGNSIVVNVLMAIFKQMI